MIVVPLFLVIAYFLLFVISTHDQSKLAQNGVYV